MALDRLLKAPEKREAVVIDCVNLIEDEVQAKRGLTGIAVKGAYSVVKKVKPDMIAQAVERLLEPFVERLEPFYTEWLGAQDSTFESFLSQRRRAVADALLSITDQRAKRIDQRAVKKAYSALRPKAVEYVGDAVPGIARVIQKHAET